MRVAVEKGLDEISRYLNLRGYETVSIDSNLPFDAIIYQNTGILNLPVPTSYKAFSGANPSGALLIYAAGKTPQEIEHILCQKSYGNLF